MVLDIQEDYWEDASVSLGRNDGWGLPCSTLFPSQEDHETEDGSKQVLHTCEWGQPGDSSAPAIVDEPAISATSSGQRQHSFPPPISFCVTLSIKEGGRFVLKETDNWPSLQSCFRAERMNGRLRLCLYEHEQVLDEDACNDSFADDCRDDTITCDSEEFEQDHIAGDVEEIAGYVDNLICLQNVCAGHMKSDVSVDDAPTMSDSNHSCSINGALHYDGNTGIECSTLRNYEERQETCSCDQDASMETSSEMLLPMETSPWAVKDMVSHIRPYYGSFANMGPSLGLKVS